jgi:probable F420-dependent oxidoreductase
MALDIGVVLQTNPPAAQVVDQAVRADELGFSHVWTFDSHVLWQEPYVIYSQILGRTERVVVGPMVTNPGTRDWTVTASLFATLDEMFGPRTVCGIGRGDSARRYQGDPPATLPELGTAIEVIRGLVRGGEVTYGDTRLTFPWWPGSPGFEVWMAAYGPKALGLCGQVADGYILQLADPDVTAWMVAGVRSAAEEAGRDPDDLTICVAAPAYVGDDMAHMRDQCRWFGGMVGNHVADIVARYGTDGSAVPRALTDYIAGRTGYDYAEHGRAGNPHTEFVPDEIVDRFCILGPVEAHRERLAELEALGVDQFAVYLQHDATAQTLEAYGAGIVPAVSGG